MPYAKEDTTWQGVVNPATGKPFGSYEDYSSWSTLMGEQAGAGGSAWGTAGAAPAKGSTMSEGFGWNWEAPGSSVRDYSGSVGFAADKDSPYYGTTGNVYTQDINGYKTGDIHVAGYQDGQYGEFNSRYDPNADYGLGPDYIGVLPVGRNEQGVMTDFFVLTPGGGGIHVNDLEQARELAQAYRDWLGTRPIEQGGTARAPAPGTSTAPIASTGGNQGILTVPGQGEKTFEDIYPELRAGPQRGDRAFGDRPTQPTESEQYWNKWEGIFGSPDSLTSMYDRAQQKAQSTLDRKASSAGWADSSAAAKATANIGLDFQDAATRATMDWAKTGAGIASGVDTSKNAQTRSWLDTVGTADKLDATDLAYKLGAMGASKTAQELAEGRETGGVDRAMAIGSAMANLANQGFQAANQEDFARFMVDLQLQMQAGNIDYAAATQKLNEYAALFGTSLQASSALANAWKQTAGAGYEPEVIYGQEGQKATSQGYDSHGNRIG